MSENDMIRKGQFFYLRYDGYMDVNKILLQAKVDIKKSDLMTRIANFMQGDSNSYQYCENKNMYCQASKEFHEFDMSYIFCPFCGEPLQTEYQTPTIHQFLESHHTIMEKVVVSTHVNTDLKEY